MGDSETLNTMVPPYAGGPGGGGGGTQVQRVAAP